VGDLLVLKRVPIELDPTTDYVSIGVRSFGKGIFHYEPKPGDRLGKLRYFSLPADHLVISNIKGWEGAVAVSDERDQGCVASNRFLAYAPVDENEIDVRWARWYFLSDEGLDLIQRASPGSADRNRTLAMERFASLEIPVPPIGEQRAVAARLDAAWSGSSRVGSNVDRATELSKALAVSSCSRPDLPDDTKERSGWRRISLGTVMAPIADRTTVDVASSYPNLGIYSFGRGVFEKQAIDGGGTSATVLNRVSAGQFIYSRLFAFEGAYAHVPSAFDGFFVSNEFPMFDPDPEQLDARWLAAYLRSPARWLELAGSSKGLGVRRQRIPVEAVLAYEVWLPPIPTQRAMVTVLDRLDRAERGRQEVRQRIASLVPAAMNEVFAGSASR
jgi:type I restriction enzyme S subunit